MSPDTFPILRRFPARNPHLLQLFSVPTPNGVKASIMLEEIGLDYEPHFVPFGPEGTESAEFRSLSRHGKIPAIIDPGGPGGEPLGLFESGAILLYLADKSGRLISSEPALRWETIQWLFWQMAAMGPMFGQVGFFHKFAGRKWKDKRPLQRYVAESKRVLATLDQRLEDRTWVVGDYSIADISMLGWARNLITFYEAREVVDFDDYANVAAWLGRGLERPAVQRGLKIPAEG